MEQVDWVVGISQTHKFEEDFNPKEIKHLQNIVLVEGLKSITFEKIKSSGHNSGLNDTPYLIKGSLVELSELINVACGSMEFLDSDNILKI